MLGTEHKKEKYHVSVVLLFRDLHSYLLGDQEENENNANQAANNNNQQPRNNANAIPVVGEGLHAAHQAILQQGGPVGFQPYHRPVKFPLRVIIICVLLCSRFKSLKVCVPSNVCWSFFFFFLF